MGFSEEKFFELLQNRQAVAKFFGPSFQNGITASEYSKRSKFGYFPKKSWISAEKLFEIFDKS